LTTIEKNELDLQLSKLGHSSGIQKESAYVRYEIRDQQRQKNNQELLELIASMTSAFFKCAENRGELAPRSFPSVQ
jgi:hypothetical protein